jgi:hypothetical protein
MRLSYEEQHKRHAENRMPFFSAVRHASSEFYGGGVLS